MHTHNSSKLTKLFIKFKRTKDDIDYKVLYEAILLYAYNFPLLLSHKNVNHTGAFALFIQEKIHKIIYRFNFYGIPLENYLYTVFKGQFFTYLKYYIDKEKKQSMNTIHKYYKSLNIPAFVMETNTEYETIQEDMQLSSPAMTTQNPIVSIDALCNLFKHTYQYKTFCKRMWIYILKYSPYFDDEVIGKFALQVGIDTDTCINTLQILNVERHKRQEKQKTLEKRSTILFSKYLEKTLLYQEQYEYLTTQEKNTLLHQIDETHNTYQKFINKKTEKRYTISNQVLSEVLHIPKGSIDSSIYHLKKMCKNVLAKTITAESK